jgi:hypothetical protein
MLQEQLLCPRALNFPSTGGVIWQCDTESASDGSAFHAIFEEGPDRLVRNYRGYPEDARYEVPANQLHDSWTFAVDDYNNRRLSESGDKLIAIAGLAEEYHSHFGKQLGTYLAGHWFNSLRTNLFWHVPKLACQSRPNVYRAPSWSWAAVDGAQCYPGSLRDVSMTRFFFEIIECSVDSVAQEHPFGPISRRVLGCEAYSERCFLQRTVKLHIDQERVQHLWISESTASAGRLVP